MDDTALEALARRSDTTETRRALLRASLGGFALAASGLFLPEAREVADAREGALGGANGGRHGQTNRSRHRRRNRRHKRKHDGRHDSAGGWLNVALSIHNLRPAAVAVRQWKMIGFDDIIRWGTVTDWLPIDGKPETGSGHGIDFVTDLKVFAVEINTGHVVEVGNPLLSLLPYLNIRVGGWSEHGWDPQGATLIKQGFFEGEVAKAPGFAVQRQKDTATHKQFLVDLVPV